MLIGQAGLHSIKCCIVVQGVEAKLLRTSGNVDVSRLHAQTQGIDHSLVFIFPLYTRATPLAKFSFSLCRRTLIVISVGGCKVVSVPVME